jgi:pimeloyl-ACP methyl ester carboxylesterase
LIVSRQLRRPIVVGHSLGGTIAVLFGETHPHDAVNIVTVEGGYPVASTQARRNASVTRSIAPYETISQAQVAATFHLRRSFRSTRRSIRIRGSNRRRTNWQPTLPGLRMRRKAKSL